MIFPFPPFPHRANGVSVRYFPVIEYLSKKHTLDIVVIGKNPQGENKLDGLRRYCRKLILVQREDGEGKPLWAKLSLHLHSLLPWSPPLIYEHYNKDDIVEHITGATKQESYDALLWVTAHSSACIFPLLKQISAKRLVIDFIDSPSLLAMRKKQRSRSFAIREQFECWKIRNWETSMNEIASSTIYISPVDASYNTRIRREAGKGIDLPNGIGTEDYTTDRKGDIRSPSIGFLGNMGYPPNIEAAEWLYDRIFLPLSKKISDLSLVLIGRNPSDKIRWLGNQSNVFVTGEVPTIWPYVNAVDLFIFPLWMGGGIKNKILEAMYARRTVMTTEIGNEGIAGINGKHLYICYREKEFLEIAKRMLGSKEERNSIGLAAHEFVVERFSWPKILFQFEKMILGS